MAGTWVAIYRGNLRAFFADFRQASNGFSSEGTLTHNLPVELLW